MKIISLYVDDDLHSLLKEEAENDKRSVNQTAIQLINLSLKERERQRLKNAKKKGDSAK